MLILPMVGVLHRALTAILRRIKKLGRKQRLLAKRANAVARRRRAAANKPGLLTREVVQIVIGSKTKKNAAAKNKPNAANVAPKRVRKAKISRENLANVAPNIQARRVARRLRSRRTPSQ
jgi:hypothetical protein